jgi:hypothetical protein
LYAANVLIFLQVKQQHVPDKEKPINIMKAREAVIDFLNM